MRVSLQEQFLKTFNESWNENIPGATDAVRWMYSNYKDFNFIGEKDLLDGQIRLFFEVPNDVDVKSVCNDIQNAGLDCSFRTRKSTGQSYLLIDAINDEDIIDEGIILDTIDKAVERHWRDTKIAPKQLHQYLINTDIENGKLTSDEESVIQWLMDLYQRYPTEKEVRKTMNYVKSKEFNPGFDTMDESLNEGWRGCPDIEMEYYNTQADPSLIYDGYRFNYWDIEDALWSEFLMETGHNDSEADDPEVEEEFNRYVQENATSYLDDAIFGGYFTGDSRDWRDRFSESLGTRAYYFGKEEAEKYGDMILQNLSGKTVSKAVATAEEPGGLVYEAGKLGIDMWDLLGALEGLCYQGKAREIDDSTYLVG